MQNDFIIRGSLAELDPAVYELSQVESERQFRKVILIASESVAPQAVLDALHSPFNNIYAEGYPDEASRKFTQDEIVDYARRLPDYRRNSDPRYYKGVEYADAIEALARRRCAELFATDRVSADGLFVNVQALSGGPANNAVYHLINPGDTIMGLDLIHGGHLSHGAKVNRSGKYFNAVPYGIDPATERIDFEQVRALAKQHRPKLLIGGYSSYPWAVDWAVLRSIADEVGALLLADIAHVAGLVAAGEYPSPFGIADVVTFTTHKSLCGPRGACVVTHRADLAEKLDRAVFPGEQGGPHLNSIAAMAVMFKLNNSPQFKALQQQIKANAVAFAARLAEHGFRIPFGGTETHLFNLDTKSVVGPGGSKLRGDMASRILDLAGIVVNRNTIPGDKSALNPSGLRLGTVWITQRGFKEADVHELADHMAEVLRACKPYTLKDAQGKMEYLSKVEWQALNDARVRVRDLAQRMGADGAVSVHGYPHFYYLDDEVETHLPYTIIEVSGSRAARALQLLTTSDVLALKPGESQRTVIPTPQEGVAATLTLVGESAVRLHVQTEHAVLVQTWLRDVVEGYIAIDPDVLEVTVPGPLVVTVAGGAETLPDAHDPLYDHSKPFWANPQGVARDVLPALPDWTWTEPDDAPMKRTALYDTHKALGAKLVPFAGWEMPVWYGSVKEEHAAVRTASGLFDVSHMGVWDASGPRAAEFLDGLIGNNVYMLKVGASLYSQLLDPDANVIDDLMIYRIEKQRYLIVVNASNDDKDWDWVNAVREGRVLVDRQFPWAAVPGRDGVTLRNLRAPESGTDMRVDIAVQGPTSRDVILALGADAATEKAIKALGRTRGGRFTLGSFDLFVFRTGYTGEAMAFELFVHPDQVVALWNTLLEVGAGHGLKPCGLGARDSLRTEAGLPLYGHEMAGPLNLGVSEAGFGGYVKLNKAWFIGRAAFAEQSANRTLQLVRFRFNEKGVRMAHLEDPVVDPKGRVIGRVTSCAIDSEGFLTGLAVVERDYTKVGTTLGIFQGATDKPGKAPAEFKLGERVRLNDWATVVSRFP